MAKSKSVLRIWRPPNEKVQEIKSNSYLRHGYDTVFIGVHERKMSPVIRFLFYKLALSRFLWSVDGKEQFFGFIVGTCI